MPIPITRYPVNILDSSELAAIAWNSKPNVSPDQCFSPVVKRIPLTISHRVSLGVDKLARFSWVQLLAKGNG